MNPFLIPTSCFFLLCSFSFSTIYLLHFHHFLFILLQFLFVGSFLFRLLCISLFSLFVINSLFSCKICVSFVFVIFHQFRSLSTKYLVLLVLFSLIFPTFFKTNSFFSLEFILLILDIPCQQKFSMFNFLSFIYLPHS